ncbi:MAG: hypothetical protein ACJ8CR_06170, partial [Roseiflexaceae bacterium]
MSIKRFIALLVALAALLTPTLAYHPSSAQAATPASPAAVITWNGIARRAAIQVAGQTTAHAMTSIAFAQAAAAHHVLVHYFPAQQAALDADYAVALAAVPDGTAKTAGIT